MINLEISLLNRLVKAPFPAGHQGMRYYLISADKENFTAYTYPEPFCFEATPMELKTAETFLLSQEGLEEAEKWLNQQYKSRLDEWKIKRGYN